MKSIAVFDDPKHCYSCPCYNGITCHLLNTQVGTASAMLRRLRECPLKQFPLYRHSRIEWGDGDVTTHDLTDFDKGWNECVQYLEGENDD